MNSFIVVSGILMALVEPAFDGQPLTIKAHTGKVHGLAFSPDGQTLATAGAGSKNAGELKFWIAGSSELWQSSSISGSRITHIGYSRDGNSFVICSGSCGSCCCWGYVSVLDFKLPVDGRLAEWDHTRPVVDRIRANPVLRQQDLFDDAAFSHDGWTLAAVTRGYAQGRRVVLLLQPATGMIKHKLQLPQSVVALAIASDGARVAVAAKGQGITIMDVPSGTELARISDSKLATALAFSPDGRLLAGVRGPGPDSPLVSRVLVWDSTTGIPLRQLDAQGRPIRAIEFSPNGRQLAIVGANSDIKIWDTSSGAELCALRNQPGTITCIAFSPDGKTLAAGSDEGSVTLWPVSAEENNTP